MFDRVQIFHLLIYFLISSSCFFLNLLFPEMKRKHLCSHPLSRIAHLSVSCLQEGTGCLLTDMEWLLVLRVGRGACGWWLCAGVGQVGLHIASDLAAPSQ